MTTLHEAWLSLTKEEAIEPELPICDPHHHLWDYPDKLTEGDVPVFPREPRHYLLNDLLDDIDGGHNILKTVFLECNAMYRKGGRAELRWVGETEFVNGIAAQANSGLYGKTDVRGRDCGIRGPHIGRRGGKNARSTHSGSTEQVSRHPPHLDLGRTEQPDFAFEDSEPARRLYIPQGILKT